MVLQKKESCAINITTRSVVDSFICFEIKPMGNLFQYLKMFPHDTQPSKFLSRSGWIKRNYTNNITDTDTDTDADTAADTDTDTDYY